MAINYKSVLCDLERVKLEIHAYYFEKIKLLDIAIISLRKLLDERILSDDSNIDTLTAPAAPPA